jgi:hypothetical protein
MDGELKQYCRSSKQWTKIVNTILTKQPGFLEVEDTDHEFRDDSRNIVKLAGKKIWLPLDSLAYNVEKDWRHLKKILDCYNKIAQ